MSCAGRPARSRWCKSITPATESCCMKSYVLADKEKFCSAYCEGLKGSTERMCDCGHPACKGDALKS